ncbi:DUF3291 domain-containing protein [Marinihelvus fidelis]|uniref:DUF3291 domain-containing protein n=1 Tax=Marinihelvus fidelis TaxID=2613842 RepID=A0A5N0T9F6_9GAMM|nr:DUF3291 domain-containing protein [Marinihelvus fidelis]KAA9131673.1 DUF3291 domain-containing protein [Marinihelvus fidelis]
MSAYQLAQLNIAHLLAPIDSPNLADFVANLDRINALAEASPGFVWRLQTDDGDATAIRDFGADYIVNLSVWADVASLFEFVYRSAHAPIMARRKEWFGRMENAYTVLWWVEAGHRPGTAEARERLDLLEREGPGPDAFTFKRAFPMPGASG